MFAAFFIVVVIFYVSNLTNISDLSPIQVSYIFYIKLESAGFSMLNFPSLVRSAPFGNYWFLSVDSWSESHYFPSDEIMISCFKIIMNRRLDLMKNVPNHG